MGFDKLAAPLAGRSVLRRAVDAFQGCPRIDRIVVVASAGGRIDEVREWISTGGIEKLDTVVEGGVERQDSVWNGLMAVAARGVGDGGEPVVVAVHDGARPLVSPEAIARVVDMAAERGAASLARPITETVKRTDESGVVRQSVERGNLWAMETPQAFRLGLLMRAYRKIRAEGRVVTDEVSAVQALGEPVWLVEARAPNPKITFAEDLAYAETIHLAAARAEPASGGGEREGSVGSGRSD